MVILTLLSFSCSIFGTTDGIVLCLHKDGAIHIELGEKKTFDSASDCAGGQKALAINQCPSCTDVVLESSESQPASVERMDSAFKPLPLTGGVLHPYQTLISQSRAEFAMYPPRGPPEVEPASLWVSRTIVLRR